MKTLIIGIAIFLSTGAVNAQNVEQFVNKVFSNLEAVEYTTEQLKRLLGEDFRENTRTAMIDHKFEEVKSIIELLVLENDQYLQILSWREGKAGVMGASFKAYDDFVDIAVTPEHSITILVSTDN